MIKVDKKNQKIRKNPNNIKFQDLVTWLKNNGFSLDRVSGSHHIFVHSVIESPINVQKKKDGDQARLTPLKQKSQEIEAIKSA